MKDAENIEIELLLRDLAKNNRADTGTKTGATAEHLDADELSSFAEGVLPAATRSLYAEHLADCDRCRKMVAQLAMAAGVGAPQKLKSRSSLFAFLGRIFTPTVLRYAMPALALVILATVGIVWMRQQRASDLVVQRSEPAHVAEPQVLTNESNDQPVAGNEQAKQASAAKETTKSRAETKAGAIDAERNSKVEDNVPTAASEEKAKDEPKPPASSVAVARPAAEKEADAKLAPAPAKSAPAAAKTEQEAAKEEAGAGRDELSKRRAQPQSADTVSRNEAQERTRRDKADEANKKVEARRAFGGLTSGTGANREQQTTTRTVGGHRFRRVDNVWVDTSYNGSSSITNVTRGSEQYRALIGDEPGLRVIAEQLEGELIVVWKGKPYRIR